ncbi:hypothetical protein XENTR_v10018215 [Xenopus tropicalis]|nr:hypothetical protein XENTR_v10018215 [Xenopus tropicalis]
MGNMVLRLKQNPKERVAYPPGQTAIQWMEQNHGNWVTAPLEGTCKKTGMPDTGRLDRVLWETLIDTHDKWLRKKGYDTEARVWLAESKKKPGKILECFYSGNYRYIQKGKLPASWPDGSILDDDDPYGFAALFTTLSSDKQIKTQEQAEREEMRAIRRTQETEAIEKGKKQH